MLKKTIRISLPLITGLGLIGGLALGGVACGDDGGSSSSSATPLSKPRTASRVAATKPVAGGKVSVAAYTKVDEELRHSFTDSDFVPDAAGDTNRDPFRSWVLQPVLDTNAEVIKVVDVCSDKKVRWGASSYSIRDLNLIGLVKRGRSYAQFSDASESDSWIVRKGDCIGQEKAIIEEIGVGYVRLSITPPAPPGAAAPPPQKQDISLYPEELKLPSSIISDTGER